jgi:hypothetical protein
MFACMDGDDLRDVWRYDMQAEVWREVSTYSRPEPALGRCHGMCLLGRKMVFFGGTCDASNRVTMLDLHTNKWHSPKVLGRTIGRVSHTATRCGTKMYIFGGCNGHQSSLAACSVLDLMPENTEEDEEEDEPEPDVSVGTMRIDRLIQANPWLQMFPRDMLMQLVSEIACEGGEDDVYEFVEDDDDDDDDDELDEELGAPLTADEIDHDQDPQIAAQIAGASSSSSALSTDPDSESDATDKDED